MKRKFCLMTLVAVLICACIALSACVLLPGENNDKDKKLNSPTDITIKNISENSIFV